MLLIGAPTPNLPPNPLHLFDYLVSKLKTAVLISPLSLSDYFVQPSFSLVQLNLPLLPLSFIDPWSGLTNGLYYKLMTIKNDDSRVVNKLEASLTDNAGVIIYNCHVFLVQATRFQLSFLDTSGQGYAHIILPSSKLFYCWSWLQEKDC